MSIRISHISDIHIGSYQGKTEEGGINSRFLDFAKTYQQAIDFTVQNSDLCLIAGDIFRTKDPQPSELDEFTAGLKKLMDKNIPVVIVLGNHDIFLSKKLKNSLALYQTLKLPNVIISDIPEIFKLKVKNEYIQIQTMPYQHRNILKLKDHLEVAIWMEKNINDIYETRDKNVKTIFIGHFSLKDSKKGSEESLINKFAEPVISKSIFLGKDYEYIGLGHLHTNQKVSDKPVGYYTGSINRTDFNEWKEDKGFMFIELNDKENKYEFKKVDARKFCLLEYNLSKEENPQKILLEEIEKREEEIKDSIVKLDIIISEKNQDKYNSNEIIEKIKNICYHIHGCAYPHVLTNEKITNEKYTDRMSSKEALKIYCDNNKNLIDKDLFIKLGYEIIQKIKGV